MKKNLTRILAMVMAMAMVVSLAACGGDEKGSSSAASDKTSSTAGTDSSADTDSSTDEKSSSDESKAGLLRMASSPQFRRSWMIPTPRPNWMPRWRR